MECLQLQACTYWSGGKVYWFFPLHVSQWQDLSYCDSTAISHLDQDKFSDSGIYFFPQSLSGYSMREVPTFIKETFVNWRYGVCKIYKLKAQI